MKMKLFNYGYLIRYGFDLGRIFPIVIKQREVARIIAGISAEINDAPTFVWMILIRLSNNFSVLWSGINSAIY